MKLKIFNNINRNKIPSDWKIEKLEQITKIITKGTTPTTYGYDFVDKGVNFIKIESINDVNGTLNENMFNKITKECHKKLSRSEIQENDILFAIAGSLGKCAKVRKSNLPANINQALAIIRLKDNINNDFIFQQLKGPQIQKYISKLVSNTAQPNINLKQLSGFPIVFPSKKEQEKIVEILSAWDLAIGKQEQLIEKKKELKKGLMQRLLNGEVRFKEFKDEWNNKTLGHYIVPVSRECSKPNEGYWRLGLRSHAKGTFHEFVEDPSTVSMDKLYRVKCNDLIVNITFAWEHAIAVADNMDEDKLVSHRFPTYEFKGDAYPQFFKYYILQPRFRHMLVNISPGGAGRNRVMNKKDFLNINVRVPSYKEQVRIAEVLTVADKEIELLEKELEALKLQKKGLMQRLLTGEVRVNISE